jgi:hypothetical protein
MRGQNLGGVARVDCSTTTDERPDLGLGCSFRLFTFYSTDERPELGLGRSGRLFYYYWVLRTWAGQLVEPVLQLLVAGI